MLVRIHCRVVQLYRCGSRDHRGLAEETVGNTRTGKWKLEKAVLF